MNTMKKIIPIVALLLLSVTLHSCMLIDLYRLRADYRRISPKEWAEYRVVEQEQKRLNSRLDSITYNMEPRSRELSDALEATFGELRSLDAVEDSLMFIMVSAQLNKLEQRRQPLGSRNLRRLHFISQAIFSTPEVYGSLRDRAAALYDRLGDKRKASEMGRKTELLLYPLPEVKVGDKMADATLPDLEGNMHTLSDYLDKEKCLLLDFWGSWCSPCIDFIPVYKALHEEYGGEMTVIGINVNDSATAWAKASEEHGITWLNLRSSDSELINRYRISSYPRAILVDPEGTVLAIDHPGQIIDYEYCNKKLNK
jgi:thiol-disulfide isomerase/thioredoxin